MNQRDDKQHLESIRLNFYRLVGAIAGATIAYLVTSNLPSLSSALVCAMAIALVSLASTRLSHPFLWWANLGAIPGSVIGTAIVLVGSVDQLGVPQQAKTRYIIIGCLGIAGLVSGIFLGRTLDRKTKVPRPKDFVKVVSGLTAGVVAVVVTIQFTFQGLDKARTLSSRLSTATTILVTAVAAPGWLGYQLGRFLSLKNKLPRQQRR